MSAAAMAQALAPQQRVAGDVLPMSPRTNLSSDELYNRILQSPSGMQQINRAGGVQNMPHNVIPLPPFAPAGKRVANNAYDPVGGNPAWMSQPLRAAGGQFVSPQAPLPVVGPAQYRNGMRAIGMSPPVYNNPQR
jgi:hypothetical protein